MQQRLLIKHDIDSELFLNILKQIKPYLYEFVLLEEPRDFTRLLSILADINIKEIYVPGCNSKIYASDLAIYFDNERDKYELNSLQDYLQDVIKENLWLSLANYTREEIERDVFGYKTLNVNMHTLKTDGNIEAKRGFFLCFYE